MPRGYTLGLDDGVAEGLSSSPFSLRSLLRLPTMYRLFATEARIYISLLPCHG